ncbi:hypothetical protein Patl1_26612 [Pistacia atlantica]|uniref:Uncharacterized protein n=1 Tax=Pistacia atlantica TaxID=434234 RepID=A0ACC1AZF2_9ROSI|nr:hypothetical protein Patl1_26612 [Pistacia atlantica]
MDTFFIGRITNLYQSAMNLEANNYMKSTQVANTILSPKLASKFGCRNQLLPIEEEAPMQFNSYTCYACFSRMKRCIHTQSEELAIMNPKLPGITKKGGGFVNREGLLLVTNDLVIKPLSRVSDMHHLNKLKFPLSDLEEKVVEVDEEEVKLNHLQGV